MGTSEKSIIPENAASILAEAITRAGEYTPGHRAKVQFSGAFHDGEGFNPSHDMRDGKLSRRREFTTTLKVAMTERFLQQPSLDIIFDSYGLPLDRLVALEVDSIAIEYVA